MHEQNPRLIDWDRKKAARERQLIDEASVTDSSNHTPQRIEEVDAYELYLERVLGHGRHLERNHGEVGSADSDMAPVEEMPEVPNVGPEPVSSKSLRELLEASNVQLVRAHQLGADIVERVRRPVDTFPLEEPREDTSSAKDEHLINVTQFVTSNPNLFDKPRSVQETVRHIPSGEIADRMTLLETQRATPIVRELMSYDEFLPAHGIEVDNRKFTFSDLFSSGKYTYSVCYEYNSDQTPIKPRLYYRSQSDGGWRVTPGITAKGIYSKGIDNHRIPEYGQYVQATKPDENIVSLLEGLDDRQGKGAKLSSGRRSELHSSFDLNRQKDQGLATFSSEVSFVPVEGEGLDAFISGIPEWTQENRDAKREALKNMKLPSGFEPEFADDPLRIYTAKHTLAGRVGIEVYSATYEDRPIEWHIARDTHGRIWIDRIQFTDGEVTSYGTRSEIILAGALSAKPFDYNDQVGDLVTWGREPDAKPIKGTDYTDVTPLLMQMGPLSRYQDEMIRKGRL